MELLEFIIEVIGFICELFDNKPARENENKISRSRAVHR